MTCAGPDREILHIALNRGREARKPTINLQAAAVRAVAQVQRVPLQLAVQVSSAASPEGMTQPKAGDLRRAMTLQRRCCIAQFVAQVGKRGRETGSLTRDR